ncbi:MAG TPA: DUF4159 domain-containing protein [Terriglobia bacterium]|jgi:hypothetical protein
MVEKRRQFRGRFVKTLGFSTGLAIIAISILLGWYAVAAAAPVNAVTRKVVKFQFARMRYPGGVPDFIKNWYTDYPNMDDHLTTLLRRLTGIDVGPPLLVDPASPALFDYPIVYSVEPEQMVLGSREIDNLRRFLVRGGLWFADDFHGDEEFEQFMKQLRRVIPDAKPVELTTAHPLFHCFYDIPKIIQVTNDSIAECSECDQWENGPSGKIPKVFAVFDGRGRIIVLLAWNTDLGDGLEWADDPQYPAEYSAYAFRFVSNVVVYAMSH